MKLLSYCVVLLILFAKCEGKSHNAPMNNLHIDTLATVNEFRILVDNTFRKANDTTQAFSMDDAILLVKIYNTIASYSLTTKEPYRYFYAKFDEEYCKKIVGILDCKLSVGMGYYCEKHKLIIGGTKYPKDSYIVLLEL